MSGEFTDFDAAWAEQQNEPIKYKIFSKTYDIPPTVSAAFMLEVTKITADKGVDEDITAADIGRLLIAIFGKTTIDDWLDKGMTLPQLNDVLQDVLKRYGLLGGVDADPKVVKQQQKKKSEKDS